MMAILLKQTLPSAANTRSAARLMFLRGQATMLKLLGKEKYPTPQLPFLKKKPGHYHTMLLESWCAGPWVAKHSSLGKRTTNKHL